MRSRAATMSSSVTMGGFHSRAEDCMGQVANTSRAAWVVGTAGVVQFEGLGGRMAGKGNGKSGERVALVGETQAERAPLEADELITRKLRIGRVPVLFRALAAEKALLPCWQALRTAVRLRAFEEAADDLRARAAQAAVELGCPLIETQLEWAGYDLDEIDEIRGQVDVFHYLDPKMLMAVEVLGQALAGGTGGAGRGARAEQRVPRGVPQEMAHIELVPEEASGPPAKTFRSVRSHLGLGLVPDDFRALGRWPKYLELAWSDARQRDTEPRAQAAVTGLARPGREAPPALPVRVLVGDEILRSADADPARVRALVDRFRKALPGLVVDMALFKVQLDGAQQARESPFPIRWKYISSDEYTTVPEVEQWLKA